MNIRKELKVLVGLLLVPVCAGALIGVTHLTVADAKKRAHQATLAKIPAPPSPLSTPKELLAAKVLDLRQADKAMDAAFSGLEDSMRNQIEREGVPESQKEQMRQKCHLVMEGIRKVTTWELVRPGLARIYADHFTQDELEGLIVFYSSPLGQKVATEEPAMQKQTTQFVVDNIYPRLEASAEQLAQN